MYLSWECIIVFHAYRSLPLFVLSAFLETLADNPRSLGGEGKKTQQSVGVLQEAAFTFTEKKWDHMSASAPWSQTQKHELPQKESSTQGTERFFTQNVQKKNQHCTNGKSPKIINVSLQARCHVDVMLNVYNICKIIKMRATSLLETFGLSCT